MTPKARRRPKRKVKTKPLNLKLLQNTEIMRAFVNAVENQLQNRNVESQSSAEISINMTKILNSAAENVLAPFVNQNRCNEIQKNDQEFNRLLSQRRQFPKHDAEYKTITKAVKKRIKHLKNKKLRQETDEVNEYAN